MSFKRHTSKSQTAAGVAGAPSERISGIKPWINSQYFVSYGLRQLDELLGGGNALGTVTVVEEDHLSNHASVMFNYSIAESLSHNHQTMLVVEDKDTACEVINQLPCNLNYVGGAVPASGGAVLGTPIEEMTQDWVRKLNIKWAGGADSITGEDPQPNFSYADIAATGVVYCNSFDLSRRLQQSLLDEYAGSIRVVCAHETENTTGRTLAEVSASLLGSLKAFVAINGSAGRVGRAFIPRLDLLLNACVDSISGSSGVEAARLLLALKQLVAGSRVSLMISFLPSTMPGADMAACLCDTLVCVESFAGKESTVPAEFKNFCGYLHVKRIQQANSIASFRSSNCKYGIKRDRRKLHIEPLHLPPEESRAMQSSNAVHGSKDGAGGGGRPMSSYSSGMSCAPGNADALQF